MTVSYFIRYQGAPADRAAFDAHYAGPHAALLRDFPGIRSLILHSPVAARDPFPTNDAGLHLLSQMVFDSEAALQAALDSQARQRAFADRANFPTFNGTIAHQAMRAEVIF
jgi:uncharacterized protein (TIGR02118 family)